MEVKSVGIFSVILVKVANFPFVVLQWRQRGVSAKKRDVHAGKVVGLLI